jgi:hypothetical protein
MNEVNEQSLPAGRLAGVVEFIPDQVVLIWCHLPFPCLFIIGSTDLPPWFSFACTKARVRTNTNQPSCTGLPTSNWRGYFGVKCSDGGKNQMINEAI